MPLDDIYPQLGRRIAERRRRVNLTQQQLADALGLSRASVANIERGKQAVQLHLIIRISKILDVEAFELIPVDGAARNGHSLQVQQWLSRVKANDVLVDRNRS